MKWYDSSPTWFLGWCLLCGLLGYFTGKLDIPNTVLLGVAITGSAAVAVYSTTDLKSKFPDCNSKIGYATLFLLFALACAMAEIAI